MYVLKNFVFFEDASSAGESNVLSNPNKASVLTLEVQGTGSFTLNVQGLVNVELANPTYTNLAAIVAEKLSKTESITAPGIYYIGVDGIAQIKATLSSVSGSVTVFGRLGE